MVDLFSLIGQAGRRKRRWERSSELEGWSRLYTAVVDRKVFHSLSLAHAHTSEGGCLRIETEKKKETNSSSGDSGGDDSSTRFDCRIIQSVTERLWQVTGPR